MRDSGVVRGVLWTEAQGVAAACFGLLLLGGTLLLRLGQSGPPFPSFLGASSEPVTEAADAGVLDESRPTRRATAQAAAGAAAAQKPTPAGLLDINRADAAALQGLPGIGPALALRIVAYREARGQFRRVEELREVPGIGPKRYARLLGWIRVTETP
jgi:competence ComEA-like helix-hairpin-helix protein